MKRSKEKESITKLAVYMPEELHRRLKIRSACELKTMSKLVIIAVKRLLRKYERLEAKKEA